MATNKPKHTIQQILEAIADSGGLINVICDRLEICRNTFANYRRRYKKVEEAYIQENESTKDFAEAQLITLIKDKYPPAIFFYLNNKGRDRGYGQAPAKPTEQTDEVVFNLNFGPKRKP